MNAKQRRRRRRILWMRQKNVCIWCSQPMQMSDDRADDYATFEHMIRRRDGGTDTMRNLRLAHRRCNLERG